jgi:DNA-binding transcriptional MerR regulator
MDTRDVLRVSEVSRRSGFAASALRYYEAQGLIRATRSGGGQRRCQCSVLRRLAFIRAASNIGLSLEEIRSAAGACRSSVAASATRRTWRPGPRTHLVRRTSRHCCAAPCRRRHEEPVVGHDGGMGPLPTAAVTRYVTPLREGGSLPGIVEADDLGTYVCKFRGAGQGVRVLVAEVVVGELARRLGLQIPRTVVLELDPEIARYEADEEVQDLLKASAGLNLGVDFLPGAFGYDGERSLRPGEAARVLWLDALTANVDRSWRNPNLLVWHGELWLIDHGAALYFHHAWPGGLTDPARFAVQPWDASDHILGVHAGEVPEVSEELRQRLGHDVLVEALEQVPDAWLDPVPGADSPAALREAYVAFLEARLASRAWLPGAAA